MFGYNPVIIFAQSTIVDKYKGEHLEEMTGKVTGLSRCRRGVSNGDGKSGLTCGSGVSIIKEETAQAGTDWFRGAESGISRKLAEGAESYAF